LFAAQLRGERGQASNVSTRPRKAGNEPIANRIVIKRHDNGDRASRFPGGPRIGRAGRDNDVDLKTNQLSRERGKPIEPSLPDRHSMTMFFPSS